MQQKNFFDRKLIQKKNLAAKSISIFETIYQKKAKTKKKVLSLLSLSLIPNEPNPELEALTLYVCVS